MTENALKSIAAAAAQGTLEKMIEAAPGSIDDHALVKRFTEDFNNRVRPALKAAGLKTRLTAKFNEGGTRCRISMGRWWNSEYVTGVGASDIRERLDYPAKCILDELPLSDRQKVRDVLPRVLSGLKR